MAVCCHWMEGCVVCKWFMENIDRVNVSCYLAMVKLESRAWRDILPGIFMQWLNVNSLGNKTYSWLISGRFSKFIDMMWWFSNVASGKFFTIVFYWLGNLEVLSPSNSQTKWQAASTSLLMNGQSRLPTCLSCLLPSIKEISTLFFANPFPTNDELIDINCLSTFH